jgi:hypothetical protein
MPLLPKPPMGIILNNPESLPSTNNPHNAGLLQAVLIGPDVTNFLVSFPCGRIVHEHFVYISFLHIRVTYSVFVFIIATITEYYVIMRTKFPLI